VFCDGNAHAVGIDFLKGVRADHRARDLAGDADDGDRIELGVGNSGQNVGGPGPRSCKTHLGASGRTCHALSDKSRPLFVTGQNMANPVASGQGIIKGKIRTAGNPGNGPNPLPFE